MRQTSGFFISKTLIKGLEKSMPNNFNSKPNISIEGKMSEQDTGKVAIIMAWGKSISLVIGSLAGAITAIAAFFKYIL